MGKWWKGGRLRYADLLAAGWASFQKLAVHKFVRYVLMYTAVQLEQANERQPPWDMVSDMILLERAGKSSESKDCWSFALLKKICAIASAQDWEAPS
jgi:hypothetical protein